MATHCAFLRGINVGGRRTTMDRMCAPFEALGLEGVQSVIASGNVVFATDRADLAALEADLERALAEALGFTVEVFVRSGHELAEVVDAEVVQSAEPGVTPHVLFLRAPLSADGAEALRALETPDDRFPILAREVVWLRRGRLSDTTVKATALTRALGVHTARNVNTVRRIVGKLDLAG